MLDDETERAIQRLVASYHKNLDRAWGTYMIPKAKNFNYNAGLHKFMAIDFGAWLDGQIKKKGLPENDVYDALLDSL